MLKYTQRNKILTIIILFGAVACSNVSGDATGSESAPLNPNGDSELALLMREMEVDAKRMKAQIEKGEVPALLKKFERIHTAEPTEEGKTDNPEFKVYAQSYLQTIQAIKNADAESADRLYHNIVESCMNCHEAMCPGPIVRIEKLYLKE